MGRVTKALAIYCIYSILRKRAARKRRFIRQYWVNPYLGDRNRKGRFCKDFVNMRNNPPIFHENFHMDIASFEELCNLIKPILRAKRIARKDAISVEQKLAVCLEYLASGTLFRHMGSVYRISKQHVGKIVETICEVLITVLQKEIPMLSKTQLVEVANQFSNRWQFPNCLGAVDGKHIAIQAPSNSGSLFYCYKGFFSIVLFAVADAEYKFTFIEVGAYGSEGDANIFTNSDFGQAVLQDKLDFPEDAAVNGEKLPFYFIGDDAFPLCKRLIKPYGGRNKRLTEDEAIFNYRLSRARRCVENSFGILTTKWLCLKRTMFCTPDRARKIVAACCFLHNFLIKRSTIYCPASYSDSIGPNGKLVEGAFRQNIPLNEGSSTDFSIDANRGRQSNVGKLIREKIKNFVNSETGAVDWQNEAIFK